eukprot:PhF_6_TR40768/c0_g1_i5/m.61468
MKFVGPCSFMPTWLPDLSPIRSQQLLRTLKRIFRERVISKIVQRALAVTSTTRLKQLFQDALKDTRLAAVWDFSPSVPHFHELLTPTKTNERYDIRKWVEITSGETLAVDASFDRDTGKAIIGTKRWT